MREWEDESAKLAAELKEIQARAVWIKNRFVSLGHSARA